MNRRLGGGFFAIHADAAGVSRRRIVAMTGNRDEIGARRTADLRRNPLPVEDRGPRVKAAARSINVDRGVVPMESNSSRLPSIGPFQKIHTLKTFTERTMWTVFDLDGM
ncbi:MAG: hypothetical protein H0T79_22125 [Deltaproteobacteria bacterium]|nr:hypothetical protein [Deltaproteobacteria bacterium]